MTLTPRDTLRPFTLASGRAARMHSLKALRDLGIADVQRLPVSLRMLLESMLRQVDGVRVTQEHVRTLATWKPDAARTAELPFLVSRILLQDFTGIPLLCDLASMRDAAVRQGRDAGLIEPLIPVDLVIDHSVQVDHHREPDALERNQALEFSRNAERYRFLKWATQAFRRLRVVPPGVGIVHQVNLERLCPGVHWQGDLCFPDSLVGTDSHTTMINALGVLAWGVGGIEAEAGMLGLPVTIAMPDVLGVQLVGRLRPGVTATDLVLTLTEALRRQDVAGQFVEFFGDGAAGLSLPDRATLANMAPEYGATVGFFPPDETAAAYLAATGRSAEQVDAYRSYFRAQQLFGMPMAGDIDYSRVITLALDDIEPSVAGPGRPQDRTGLPDLRRRFVQHLQMPVARGGFGRTGEPGLDREILPSGLRIGHGDILIAAITSCTNTSNPSLMIGAGLLARAAAERGMRVPAHVKTSLAPGSRVVTDFLHRLHLLDPLDELGFRLVAYGCTTCIGNSGPLDPELQAAVVARGLVCAAVLSGNRNFEARIHPAVLANYLMSPPLVVAFALAGRITIDLVHEPLGLDEDGLPVFLRELWPAARELEMAQRGAAGPQVYRRVYDAALRDSPRWEAIPVGTGLQTDWLPSSTMIARPPFLDGFAMSSAGPGAVLGARALAILGDSVTTDHISPAGNIPADSPAGRYLLAAGVAEADFNAYGARRGHHEVMVRGTLAHVRLRNRMVPPDADGRAVEGGFTVLQPAGQLCSIFDASEVYRETRTPTIVLAGRDYGSGSSRDWAAKGTRLLGVRAVIARSVERIHRSNLIGMGVLPLCFEGQDSAESLGLKGDERYDLLGMDDGVQPGQAVTLRVTHADGHRTHSSLRLRIDTPMEASIFAAGGMLPFVMRSLLKAQREHETVP